MHNRIKTFVKLSLEQKKKEHGSRGIEGMDTAAKIKAHKHIR
jgi:hypothetical protein